MLGNDTGQKELKDFWIVFRMIGKVGTKMLRLAVRLKIKKMPITD